MEVSQAIIGSGIVSICFTIKPPSLPIRPPTLTPYTMDDWETDSADEDLPRGILQVQVYDDRSSSSSDAGDGEEVVFSHDEPPTDEDDDAFDGVDAFDDMSDDSDSQEDDEELDTEHEADFEHLVAADRERRAAARRQAPEGQAGTMPGSFPTAQGDGEAPEPEEDRVQCESLSSF